MENSTPVGRRRGTTKHSAEDQALDQIAKEAEARLAARRQARAEAREIRMRELERQQKEAEENADRLYDMHPETALRTPPARSVSQPRTPVVNNSNSSGGSGGSNHQWSRRSSEDSLEDGGGGGGGGGGGSGPGSAERDGRSVRDLRHELKEVEDKFRKAMIQNAQLDNEKASYTYQVELLKDKVEDLEVAYAQLQRENREKCREADQLKRLSQRLKEDLDICRAALEERDRLIQEQGLVIVGDEGDLDGCEDGEKQAPRKALVSVESAEMLQKAGEGSLDVRLRKLAEERNELLDQIRHLKLELEEERSRHRNGPRTLNGPADSDMEDLQREAQKLLGDYKFKLQKAEQDVSTLQANVARLESQVIRYKSAAETAEKVEDELKVEKRKLQREDENCLEDLGSTAESDYNFKEVIRFEETVEKESIYNNDTKEEYKEDDFWAVITADTGEKHNGPQALIDTENLSLIETGETSTDNLKIPCTRNFEEFTMIDNDQPENDESFEAISGIAYLLGEDNADCQPIATEGERENGYNDSSATSENEEVDFWAKLKDDDDCTYHLEPEKDALSNSFELNSSSDFVEEKDNVEDIPKKDEGGILKKDTEEENPIKQAQSEEDFWAKLTEQPVETSVSEDSLSLLPSDKLSYSNFLCGNDSLVTDMCTDFASEEIEDIDILDYLDGAIIWKMNEEATLTSNAFQSDHHVELDDLDFMDGVMIWEESTEIQDCKMQPGEINQFELVRRTSPDVDEPLLYNIESKELQDIQMCSVEDNLVKEEIEWRSFSPTSKETNDISDKIFASPEEEEKQHIEHSSVKNISTSRFPKCSRIPKPKKRSQHQNLELTDTTTSNISVDVMDLDCKGSKRRDQARDRDRDRRNRKSGRGSQF